MLREKISERMEILSAMEVPSVCLSKCSVRMQPSLFIPRRETPLVPDKRRLSLLFDVFLKVDFLWTGWGGGGLGCGEKHVLCNFLEVSKSDKPFVEFRLDSMSRDL